MQVTHITADRREEWNAFVVREPSFALLQSWEWGEYKEKLGWQTCRIAVEKQGRIVAGAQVLIKPVIYGITSITYIPRGPLVNWKNQEIAATLFDAIHQAARHYRAIFLRIEPPLLHSHSAHNMLRAFGFQHVEHTSQPRCTMIVDLPEDMNELLMSLSYKTRNNIRRSERKGVTIEIADETLLPTFHHIMKVTGARSNFSVRNLDYYEHMWQTFNRLGQSQVLLARYEDQILAAVMAFYFGKHAAVFHGGSLNQHRNLDAFRLTLWHSMCWAREQGCHTLDLWGIPDEVGELTAQGKPIPKGQKGGLWGVYYHKRVFGGRVVYYVGAYDYVYASLPYQAAELATSRLGSTDKLAKISDLF